MATKLDISTKLREPIKQFGNYALSMQALFVACRHVFARQAVASMHGANTSPCGAWQEAEIGHRDHRDVGKGMD